MRNIVREFNAEGDVGVIYIDGEEISLGVWRQHGSDWRASIAEGWKIDPRGIKQYRKVNELEHKLNSNKKLKHTLNDRKISLENIK